MIYLVIIINVSKLYTFMKWNDCKVTNQLGKQSMITSRLALVKYANLKSSDVVSQGLCIKTVGQLSDRYY